jgi:hypothetical protein
VGVLLLPIAAVEEEGAKKYCFLKKGPVGGQEKRYVETGVSDESDYEIVSGLTAQDTVMIKEKRYAPPKKKSGTNPFMPSRRKDSNARN